MMEPYYQDAHCTIWHADCREVLPQLEGAVDLVLTDPPYGVNFRYLSYDDTQQGHAANIAAWFALMTKCAKTVAISCGVPNIWLWPPAAWILCWHKPFSVSHSPMGANNWEPLLVYHERGERRERQSDYFCASFVKEHTLHPCPKPLAWAKGALKILSRPGETVLDPFMGSGTTLRAAKDLGRKAIGIEIEECYAELAAKRLQQEVLPLRYA